mmetsp:Transcript_87156/g.150821  ORF Transcript_87156/g.150821 Transcript_87156/m.150821 type:complete len:202 (-) Transcript_87156:490-1095(-)
MLSCRQRSSSAAWSAFICSIISSMPGSGFIGGASGSGSRRPASSCLTKSFLSWLAIFSNISIESSSFLRCLFLGAPSSSSLASSGAARFLEAMLSSSLSKICLSISFKAVHKRKSRTCLPARCSLLKPNSGWSATVAWRKSSIARRARQRPGPGAPSSGTSRKPSRALDKAFWASSVESNTAMTSESAIQSRRTNSGKSFA